MLLRGLNNGVFAGHESEKFRAAKCIRKAMNYPANLEYSFLPLPPPLYYFTRTSSYSSWQSSTFVLVRVQTSSGSVHFLGIDLSRFYCHEQDMGPLYASTREYGKAFTCDLSSGRPMTIRREPREVPAAFTKPLR